MVSAFDLPEVGGIGLLTQYPLDGDIVAPLTSAVVRFDAASGRIDRFQPHDEVLDQALRDDAVAIATLIEAAP